MIALFGKHRAHRARHRSVREDLLHFQLIFAHEIDRRRENDVVEEVRKRDVEGVEDVIAELHRQRAVSLVVDQQLDLLGLVVARQENHSFRSR